jgi:hypothetical protein
MTADCAMPATTRPIPNQESSQRCRRRSSGSARLDGEEAKCGSEHRAAVAHNGGCSSIQALASAIAAALA